VVAAGWVNTVLVGHDFPELGADLIAALSSLDMHNLPNHGNEVTEILMSSQKGN
jgi:hypothetical protein